MLGQAIILVAEGFRLIKNSYLGTKGAERCKEWSKSENVGKQISGVKIQQKYVQWLAWSLLIS